MKPPKAPKLTEREATALSLLTQAYGWERKGLLIRAFHPTPGTYSIEDVRDRLPEPGWPTERHCSLCDCVKTEAGVIVWLRLAGSGRLSSFFVCDSCIAHGRSMKIVVFRVRLEYFLALEAMLKNVELRKDSEFWRKRLLGPHPPTIALFLCGPRKLYRRITEIRADQDPEVILGRPLSEQGRHDIPTPTCFAIFLGEVVAGAKGSRSLK
jgi:hypothetical protein